MFMGKSKIYITFFLAPHSTHIDLWHLRSRYLTLVQNHGEALKKWQNEGGVVTVPRPRKIPS